LKNLKKGGFQGRTFRESNRSRTKRKEPFRKKQPVFGQEYKEGRKNTLVATRVTNEGWVQRKDRRKPAVKRPAKPGRQLKTTHEAGEKGGDFRLASSMPGKIYGFTQGKGVNGKRTAGMLRRYLFLNEHREVKVETWTKKSGKRTL